MYVTDGIARQTSATATRATGVDVGTFVIPIPQCDPEVGIPDRTCDGWLPSQETVPSTPPPTEAPGPDLQTATCAVGVDYPHRSTTAAYAGNINVHAHNNCTAQMYQSVQAVLDRESCFFWIFCNWNTIKIGTTYTNSLARSANANAASPCNWQSGWYRGQGYHLTIYNGQSIATRTKGNAMFLACW